jgi:hypothetical protein
MRGVGGRAEIRVVSNSISPQVRSGTGATLFAAALAPNALTSAVVGSGGSAYPLEVTGQVTGSTRIPTVAARAVAIARLHAL